MKAYLHVTSLYASFQFLYFPLSCILKDGLGERTRLNVFSLGPCLFPDELTSFCAEDFSACRYAVLSFRSSVPVKGLFKVSISSLDIGTETPVIGLIPVNGRVTNDDPPDDKALLEYRFV